MTLGADQIIALIRNKVDVEDQSGTLVKKPLVEGLEESQIDGIEGSTLDLRLGALHRLLDGASLKVNERITPRTECVLDIERGDKSYILQPDCFYLVQTIETVNLPRNLVAYISNRTTLFRCGIYLKTAFVSPNYQGKLTFGLKNVGQHPVEIEPGFRIACIAFFEIKGTAVPYKGVWGGERISTEGIIERPF